MTPYPERSGGDAGCGLHQSVQAGGNAIVAGRDIYIDYAGAPTFAVQGFVAPAPAGLAELAQARQQPSVLLTAQRQTIVFTGRAAEMTELRQWQDGPAACSVWAWHAAGGQGKTRLGQEVGRQSAAAGWRVGAATHQDAAPGVAGAKPLATPWRWRAAGRRPLLLLVDYAERWPVHDLLRLLADYRTQAPKVRVLLLARSVDWWPTVAAELGRLGFTAGGEGQPRALPALASDRPGRRHLFEAACQRFAEIYQPDMPSYGWPARWDPPGDLGDDSVYGITLGVHMAALVTVDAYTRNTAPPSSAADVSRYLLNRERSYWARLHGTAPDVVRAAARTVLLACLAGPQSRDDGLRLLKLTELADDTTGQKLLDAHDRCYPPASTDTVLEPMYPDRLAEDFIALSLPAGPAAEQLTHTGHTDSWASTALLTTHRDPDGTVVYALGPLTARNLDHQPPAHTSRILIFLAAAASRNPHVKGWLHTLLITDPALAVHAGGVALTAVVAYTSPALAESIYQFLPDRSLDLDPAAALLAQRLLDHTDDTPAQRAQYSLELARRLAHTGQRKQALALARQATRIYRRLATIDLAYLPYLAVSLNNLGLMRSKAGQPRAGLIPTEQAVAIRRWLVALDQDAYLSDLAVSMINLGFILSEAGRKEDALAPSQEAAHLYRQLAQADPDAHNPNFALSLNNLSARLAEAGRKEEALTACQEAVRIRRQLAENNPDAHLPGLAMSLANLGLRLSDVGRGEDALAPSWEAAQLYRQLAQANPDAHLPDLAHSLWVYASVDVKVQADLSRALKSVTEAISLYEHLAVQLPDVFAEQLLSAYGTMADVLDGLGRATKAADLRRRLAEACSPAGHGVTVAFGEIPHL